MPDFPKTATANINIQPFLFLSWAWIDPLFLQTDLIKMLLPAREVHIRKFVRSVFYHRTASDNFFDLKYMNARFSETAIAKIIYNLFCFSFWHRLTSFINITFHNILYIVIELEILKQQNMHIILNYKKQMPDLTETATAKNNVQPFLFLFLARIGLFFSPNFLQHFGHQY